MEIRRLRMQITRSRDCARVLCNLEIGTQSQDSENAQRNLEMAQILRLRGTYIYASMKLKELYHSTHCVNVSENVTHVLYIHHTDNHITKLCGWNKF